RILLGLVNNEINEGQPNIMVVGDDDQAIYGFQGATVGNIHSFIEDFPAAPRIVLTDNYRSTDDILSRARSVITQGQDRLERLLPGINKTLTAHKQATRGEAGPANNVSDVRLIEVASNTDERRFIVDSIAQRIEAGQSPDSIAVLA